MILDLIKDKMYTLVLIDGNVIMKINESADKITINYICNKNNRVDKSISKVYDKADKSVMPELKSIFNDKNFYEVEDKEKNVALDFGLASYNQPEIFFDLVDFDFDVTRDKLPNYYKITISKSDGYGDKLSRLIAFLSTHKGIDDMEVLHDNKLDTAKHKI